MFHRNRAVWILCDDLDCYEKNFKKIKPRVINYRLYNNVSNEYYRNCWLKELKRETFVKNDQGFEKFCDMSFKLLNKHAPIKKEWSIP